VSLVLDSSATLAWIYQDEVSDGTRRIFDQVAASGAWVPSLWRLEIANGLQNGIRRKRIDAGFRAAALANLSELDITVDQETDSFAWTTTLQLADRFELTLYDAAYLELAQRRHLPLATLDQSLRAAAAAAGVELLGAAA
jgi:predicted nucleic acid-binding protein